MSNQDIWARDSSRPSRLDFASQVDSDEAPQAALARCIILQAMIRVVEYALPEGGGLSQGS
jgi:hypothetical protein